MEKELLDQMIADATSGEEAPQVSPELIELASELAALKIEKDELKAELSDINKRIAELEKTDLPELMAKAGIVGIDGKGKFTLATGETCFLSTSVFASIEKAKEADVHKALEDEGHGDMIKPTVHSQTLRAFCRERLEKGEPVPEGIKVTLETTARIRKG